MDKDSLEHLLRMGRVSEADEAFARKLFDKKQRRPRSTAPSWRTRSDPFHSFTRTAHGYRAREIAADWEIGSGPEVIVKACRQIKPRKSVVRHVAYIGRIDLKRGTPQGNTPMFYDEFGRQRTATDAHEILDEWGLPPDADNLSPTARVLRSEGREDEITALPPSKQLRNVLAWPFVLSIPSEDMETDADRLKRAAHITIARMFGNNGFQCLWTLHTDTPGRPHVHLLVKAKPRYGNRLHSDKNGDFLHAFRVELAQNLGAAGCRCRATRRMDRKHLRPAIARGEAPLQENLSQQEARNGQLDLASRLPYWWGLHGQNATRREALARQILGNTPFIKMWQAATALQDTLSQPEPSRFGRLFRKDPPLPTPVDTIPEGMRPLYREVTVGFHPSPQAWVSLCRMMLEGSPRDNGIIKGPNQSLALWYLRNRPWVFGAPTATALSNSWEKRIRRASRGMVAQDHVFPISPEPTIPTPKPRKETLEKRIQSNRYHMAWELSRLAYLDEEWGYDEDRPNEIRQRGIDIFKEPIREPILKAVPAGMPAALPSPWLEEPTQEAVEKQNDDPLVPKTPTQHQEPGQHYKSPPRKPSPGFER